MRRARCLSLPRGGITGSLVAFLLFRTLLAHADDAARQHFEIGKRLRDQGDCVRALAEFDRSLSAERSIGALYNLGYCHEQLGHRPEAYEAYRDARELASLKRDGRLREISGALAGLLETPHIRLVLPQPLPEGLELRVDDELVPATSYAAETVVFTRANRYHLVLAVAPSYEERRLTLETKQVAPIELKKSEPKAEARLVEPVVTAAPDAKGSGPGGSSQSVIGVVLLGGGLVAAGASAYLYARHRSELHDLDARLTTELAKCGTPDCPAKQKVLHNEEVADANRRATVLVAGTAAAALGLLVTGTVLLATGGSSARRAAAGAHRAWAFVPVLTRESCGAVLDGAF